MGSGVPVNAPFAKVENFEVSSVTEDSVSLRWETPKFGLVTQYLLKICVSADYCRMGKYRVASGCSELCICQDDGNPTCGFGPEAESLAAACSCLAPNTDAACLEDSDCTG